MFQLQAGLFFIWIINIHETPVATLLEHARVFRSAVFVLKINIYPYIWLIPIPLQMYFDVI